LTFTPVADANGTTVISVTVTDDLGATVTEQFTVTVTAVNDVPVASDGFYQPTENTTFTATTAEGLETLVNDIDSSNLTYSVVLQPLYGALVVNADGSFTYTPNTNFNRTDIFTFRANDSELNSNMATVTLQVDTAFPWHNGIMPLDVNDDGQANLADVLVVIDSLNEFGSRVLPVPRTRPLTAPFYDINRDGMISPLDILAMIQDINRSQLPIMRIRVMATDTAGNVLRQVTVGDSFFLTTYVMDLRPNAKGVFAAYFDVQYPAGLVSVTADPVFLAPYQRVPQFNTTITGEIDEVGAATNTSNLTGAEYEFFRVPMLASAEGVANLVVNQADQPVPQAARDLAESLGMKVSDVPDGRINYGSYQLAVLPDLVSGEGEAEGEAVARAALLDVVFRTPSPTTAAARLSLSDWILPGRSEPLVYQQAVDDTMRTLAWQPQPQLARSVDRREGELDDSDELAELIDELAADTGSGELQQ
jgi:hypothetical protein